MGNRSTGVLGRALTRDITVQRGCGVGAYRAANVALKVADIHGVPVLTDARGDTLYWFAPDSPTASHCYGTCAAYWPPVVGTLAPSTGIVGSFATLKRSDGATQVTYNGHPLYTYVGDTAPGLANGIASTSTVVGGTK